MFLAGKLLGVIHIDTKVDNIIISKKSLYGQLVLNHRKKKLRQLWRVKQGDLDSHALI